MFDGSNAQEHWIQSLHTLHNFAKTIYIYLVLVKRSHSNLHPPLLRNSSSHMLHSLISQYRSGNAKNSTHISETQIFITYNFCTKIYVYYKRKGLANCSHTLSILLRSLSWPSITAFTTWHIGFNMTKWLFPRKTYCLLPKTQVLACFIVASHILSDIPRPKICL